MCTPATCPKDCTKLAHIAGTDEAREKVRRECCCDPLAGALAEAVEGGEDQWAASRRIFGGAR